MDKIETIDPKTFSATEPYICLSTISQNDKYGIVDGNGHVVCPCVCDAIEFAMPFWIAQITYKGLVFAMDRHSHWGTYLFFGGSWGVIVDLSVPSILTIDEWELFIDYNRRLGCDMPQKDMKDIYEEFIQIIQSSNSIITREEILSMDNHEVKEYIEKSASLLTEPQQNFSS